MGGISYTVFGTENKIALHRTGADIQNEVGRIFDERIRNSIVLLDDTVDDNLPYIPGSDYARNEFGRN